MVSKSSQIAPAEQATEITSHGVKNVICMKITKLGPDLLPKEKGEKL